MCKYIYPIVLLFGLTACHFFGPTDEGTLQPIKVKPDTATLSGWWEVDSFSYVYDKKLYPKKIDKIKLHIKQNGAFGAFGLPDILFEEETNSIQHQIPLLNGQWEFEKSQDQWDLSMDFEDIPPYQKGLVTNYFLYKMNKKLVIIAFVGDPDQGNRLLFTKVK